MSKEYISCYELIISSKLEALMPRPLRELRYIVGLGLVEMAISTNPKPTYITVCSRIRALALSWALAFKQTDCSITAGIPKRADPTLVLTPSKHKTFI